MRIVQPPPPGRVLGLYTVPDAGAYYRLMVPLRALDSASWAQLDMVTEAQLDAAETVVLYRFGGRVEDVRAAVRDLRTRWGVRRVLADYDDAMFTPHPVDEVRVSVGGMDGVRVALELVDGVIVQNQALVDHFRAETDRPIAVVPNLVHGDDWPTVPPPPAEPPTIVIAGSQSHRLDWQIVLPALAWLRSTFPDVALRILGCKQDAVIALATEGRGWTHDIAAYAARLVGGAIGLCVLPDTPFNRGKSMVKAFEYSLAAGMAVVGSPTQYGPLLAGGCGFIVPDADPAGWAKCIGRYLTDPGRRAADAARLRQRILDQYDARRWADRLTASYMMEDSYVTTH